jgi:hypothetical protein
MGNALTHGKAVLSYTEGKQLVRISESIEDIDFLEQRLENIQKETSSGLLIGVYLRDLQKNCLGVALDDAQWALIYSDANASFCCFSVGDRSAQGQVEVRFEQLEYIPKWCFVSKGRGLSIVRKWFSQGELSKEIEWECERLVS